MQNLLQIQVGLRTKELRAKNGFSQERFALKIGMDRTYLASIESGRRNVTLQNLAKIATGFDMSLSEFFEGIPQPQAKIETRPIAKPSSIPSSQAPDC